MHTKLLLLGLVFVLLVHHLGLWWLARLQNPVDRQRFQLLILVLPPLVFTLLCADILVMVVRGCIHNWTPLDACLSAILITLWLVAAVLAIVMIACRHRRLERSLGELPRITGGRVHSIAAELAGRMGLRHSPELVVVPVDRPLAATIGWRKPRIFLSSWLVENLTGRELQAVLAHELVHVRRNDTLFLAVGGWIRCCAGLFPAIRRTWKDFLADQEAVVDDQAVALTRRPASMASAILKCWEGTKVMPLPSASVPSFAGGDPGNLEGRITRLLQQSCPPVPGPSSISRWVLGGLIGVVIVLALSPLYLMPSDLLLSCQFFN